MKIAVFIMAGIMLGIALALLAIRLARPESSPVLVQVENPGFETAFQAVGFSADPFDYLDSLSRQLEQTMATTADDLQEDSRQLSASRTTLPGAFPDITPLTQRTTIVNKPIPFEVMVPADWKVLSWTNPVTLLCRERTLVRLDNGPWVTSQTEFADISLREIQNLYPHLTLETEETIVIDGKRWVLRVLRGPLSPSGTHEVSLLTYGSRRGSYRMVVEGERNLLLEDARDLGLLMSSFRLPPDNFVPEEVDLVRIYVDGERIEF